MNPPFYTYPIVGQGLKKNQNEKGLLLGKNSPFNNIPILGTIL